MSKDPEMFIKPELIKQLKVIQMVKVKEIVLVVMGFGRSSGRHLLLNVI